MKLERKIIDGRAGKVPDGLYQGKHGRFMWIKDGVFHFPINMVDPTRVMNHGFPIVPIRDLHAYTLRLFVRASHCLELYPKSASDIKTIVERYGAKL